MRCLHINIKQAIFIIISIIVNHINIIQMADNNVNNVEKSFKKNVTSNEEKMSHTQDISCPLNMNCLDLNPPCIQCLLNTSCRYGDTITTNCTVLDMVNCKGEKSFKKQYICRYCYQTEPWEHTCELKGNCNSVASPRAYYTSNCTVNSDIICLGNRTFNKNIKCNWTGGYRWSTALILSITLGGFGADRFYLGHWQEGIGKLFSFGGLGVWTIIDVILISLHYLGPADGSLYI